MVAFLADDGDAQVAHRCGEIVRDGLDGRSKSVHGEKVGMVAERGGGGWLGSDDGFGAAWC